VHYTVCKLLIDSVCLCIQGRRQGRVGGDKPPPPPKCENEPNRPYSRTHALITNLCISAVTHCNSVSDCSCERVLRLIHNTSITIICDANSALVLHCKTIVSCGAVAVLSPWFP